LTSARARFGAILVVDDDALFRELVATIVKRVGSDRVLTKIGV